MSCWAVRAAAALVPLPAVPEPGTANAWWGYALFGHFSGQGGNPPLDWLLCAVEALLEWHGGALWAATSRSSSWALSKQGKTLGGNGQNFNSEQTIKITVILQQIN